MPVNFRARVRVPHSDLTLEDLDALTFTGAEPSTWTGNKLLGELKLTLS